MSCGTDVCAVKVIGVTAIKVCVKRRGEKRKKVVKINPASHEKRCRRRMSCS
jgi:hypothetical protein